MRTALTGFGCIALLFVLAFLAGAACGPVNRPDYCKGAVMRYSEVCLPWLVTP